MTSVADLKKRYPLAQLESVVGQAAFDAALEDVVSWLEKNYELPYMYYYREFGLIKEGPRFVDLPTPRMKRIDMLRLFEGQHMWRLERISPNDLEFSPDVLGQPRFFWVENASRIVLDKIPDMDYKGDIQYLSLSDSVPQWLLYNALDVLTAGVVLELADAAGAEMANIYAGKWQTKIAALDQHIEEYQYGGESYDLKQRPPMVGMGYMRKRENG